MYYFFEIYILFIFPLFLFSRYYILYVATLSQKKIKKKHFWIISKPKKTQPQEYEYFKAPHSSFRNKFSMYIVYTYMGWFDMLMVVWICITWFCINMCVIIYIQYVHLYKYIADWLYMHRYTTYTTWTNELRRVFLLVSWTLIFYGKGNIPTLTIFYSFSSNTHKRI